MKRTVFLILICVLTLFNPAVFAEDKAKETSNDEQPVLPSVFIWHLSDEDQSAEKTSQNNEEEQIDKSNEIIFEKTADDTNTPIKGYAEYEEASNTIYMQDDNNIFVLNLRIPQKLDSQIVSDGKKFNQQKDYGKYSAEEYAVSSKSFTAMEKKGDLSYGTQLESGIDTSEFERSATFFTRYEKKLFALNTAYQGNDLTTRGIIANKFYLAPELKLSRYLSISEVLSADVTRNRRTGELVLSVNPTKTDRMKMEFGAGTTYDVNSDTSWSQVRFNTKFKL